MQSILISLITRELATDEGKKRDISAAFAWIEEAFVEAKLQSHSKSKQQIALINKRQTSGNKNTKNASHEKVSSAENVH